MSLALDMTYVASASERRKAQLRQLRNETAAEAQRWHAEAEQRAADLAEKVALLRLEGAQVSSFWLNGAELELVREWVDKDCWLEEVAERQAKADHDRLNKQRREQQREHAA